MRVLVCGGRNFDNWDKLDGALKKVLRQSFNEKTNSHELVIIEGGAIGADFLARVWAIYEGYPFLEFPADWNRHGKKAGPIRNQQMLDEGKPDLVLAFPTKESVGTWDMVKRATDAGVQVEVIK